MESGYNDWIPKNLNRQLNPMYQGLQKQEFVFQYRYNRKQGRSDSICRAAQNMSNQHDAILQDFQEEFGWNLELPLGHYQHPNYLHSLIFFLNNYMGQWDRPLFLEWVSGFRDFYIYRQGLWQLEFQIRVLRLMKHEWYLPNHLRAEFQFQPPI